MSRKNDHSTPFNRALAAYLDEATTPTMSGEERVARAVPRMTKARRLAVVREFQDFCLSASSAVVEQVERRAVEVDGRDDVGGLDPRVSHENAAALYTRARVSAWRDGYH